MIENFPFKSGFFSCLQFRSIPYSERNEESCTCICAISKPSCSIYELFYLDCRCPLPLWVAARSAPACILYNYGTQSNYVHVHM